MNSYIFMDPDIEGFSTSNSKEDITLHIDPNSLYENRDGDNQCVLQLSKQDVRMLANQLDLDPLKDFNSALDFALDQAEGEGILFLRMWLDGDWEGLDKEFPEFKTSGSIPKAT